MPEAIPQTKYEVAAYLRLRGDFSKQMMRAQRATSRMDRGFGRLSKSAQLTGQRMMEGPVRAMGRMARILGTIGAVGGTAGMGGLIIGGLKYNRLMEDAGLQLATMNQMFGIAEASTGKSATNAERWATNLNIAKLSMKEFIRLQAQSPLGAKQLVTLYSQASAGLADATKNVSVHTGFIADWSVLVGSLHGDVNQLGADLSRILTGQTGAEIRTWQTFKTGILEAGKAEGKFSKNMAATSVEFVKAWNKGLTSAERLLVLQKFIGKAGGPLKTAMGESMGGLLSTTRATADTLAGAMTKPMYEQFRKFLLKVNKGTTGLFGQSSMEGWERIFGYFGTLMGNGAASLLSSFENGSKNLRDNWESIANSVYKAFQVGAFLIKAVVARALFKLTAGAALSVAGGVVGAGSRLLGRGRQAGGFLAGQFRRSHAAVGRGFLGGRRRGMFSQAGGIRHGVGHAAGRMARGLGQGVFQALGGLTKMLGGMSGLAGMSGLLATGMVMLATGMATLMTVVLPLVAGAVALGVAFGLVGVIIAGMAVYVIENWRAIAKEISAAMKTGSTTIRATLVAAFMLWNGLSALGRMILGNGKSVDVLNGVMNVMTSVINGITRSIIFFLEAGQLMASWLASFANFMAAGRETGADLIGFFADLGVIPQEEADKVAATAKSWLETRKAAEGFEMKLGDIKRQFEHFGFKKIPKLQEKKINSIMETLEAMFSGAETPKKAKVPASGVHVENMYNQWDLRNEDPDRLMAAFLPKIEALADKRTQSWETVAQGV